MSDTDRTAKRAKQEAARAPDKNPGHLFNGPLCDHDTSWDVFTIVAAGLARNSDFPEHPSEGEMRVYEAIHHRAVMRGVLQRLPPPGASDPRDALQRIGFPENAASKLSTGHQHLKYDRLAAIFATASPVELELVEHWKAANDSFTKLEAELEKDPSARPIVRLGAYPPRQPVRITASSHVILALTAAAADQPPQPEATPIGKHLAAVVPDFLASVHASAWSGTPGRAVLLAGSDTDLASATGRVTEDGSDVTLWVPTRRDPLDPSYGEHADWRAWSTLADPPVLDVMTRHSDGRPDRVVALRALRRGSAFDMVASEAVVEWPSPTLVWLRDDDSYELKWHRERALHGREAADAAHPAT